jgi:hypothetical protein
MLPLALATDEPTAQAALNAGARVLFLRAATADDIRAAAAKLPRNLILVAQVDAADADAFRKLRGHVDAAVVPPSVHAASGFAGLVAEVDP